MALVLYEGGGIHGSSIVNSEGIQTSTNNRKNSNSRGFPQTKYKGLCNQGTTCYMNSLLQTLFMTPEFRLEIYEWKYQKERHGSEGYSIPYQLQKIFAYLQNSSSFSVTTQDLTTSFQWDITELISQQDVQEFNRVLFDALEQSTINDPNPLQFSKIYQGEYLSSVICLECKNITNRNETFLDISLPILNGGNKLTYYSLESALEYYLMPGVLEGDNSYECNICKKKVKADTKVKFGKIPEILAIQLGRFCIDMKTFNRTKLYDKLIFPNILNMNNFANGYEGIKNHAEPKFTLNEDKFDQINIEKGKSENTVINEEQKESSLNIQANKNENKAIIQSTKENSNHHEERMEDLQNQESNENKKIISNPKTTETSSLEIDDQNNYKIKFKNEKFSFGKQVTINEDEEELEKALEFSKDCLIEEENLNLINQYLKEGPEVFELFSVMMHSGGAYGGHYFAFIKSFEDKTWYNFNDTNVTIIPASEVEKGFGGKNAYSLAYMLFYRRVRNNPLDFKIDNTIIPEYLLKEIARKQKEEEEENLKRIEMENTLCLRVYYKNNFQYFNVHKNDKLQVLIDISLIQFKLKDQVKKENVRLREYNAARKLMLVSYDKKEGELLSDLNFSSFREYALETKEDKEEFLEYSKDDFYLRVAVWNSKIISLDDDKLNLNPFTIQLKKNDTIMKCAEIISKKINVPIGNLGIYRKEIRAQKEISLIELSDPNLINESLKDLQIYDMTMLYVEDITIHNNANKWNTILNDEKEIIFVSFNDPHKQGNDEYIYKIAIRNTNTVHELKLKIAEMIGINENQFIMKRGSKYGAEFKELGSLLAAYDLFKTLTIYIEFGIQASVEEYRIKIFEASLSKNESQAYQINEFCEFQIRKSLKGSDMKNLITEELKAKRKIQITADYIRLRGKTLEKPEKIIKDNDDLKITNLDQLSEECGKFITENIREAQEKEMLAEPRGQNEVTLETLENLETSKKPTKNTYKEDKEKNKGNDESRMINLYDNMEFVFQILEAPEKIIGNEIIIILRNFDERKAILSPKKEVFIDPEMSLNMLSYKICNEFAEYRNKIENIAITCIKTALNVEPSNFHSYTWHLTYQNKTKANEPPFHLQGDFSIVIVKDYYYNEDPEIVQKGKTNIKNIKDMLNKHLAEKLTQGPKIPEKSMKIKIKTLQEQLRDEEEKKKKDEERKKQLELEPKVEIEMIDLFSEQSIFINQTTSINYFPQNNFESSKSNQIIENQLEPLGGWDND